MSTERLWLWVSAPFRFLYHFIVGDDWTVAVVVFIALAISGILNANHIVTWWLMPLVAIAMTGISLRRHRAPR
jgi:hypothetical protein